jgi:nucleotide-binding universal stress UspA family protein
VLAPGDSELVELAERQIAKLAEKQSKKDLSVTSFVRYGKPFKEIVALARDRDVDLIVIATRGHTGLKRFVRGSTAERVVRQAPCAVLTVPSRSAGERNGKTSAIRLQRIVVPIDFSATSVQALPYVGALAERFGAEIILFHAIETRTIPAELGYLPADVRDPGRISKQTAEKYLNNLRQQVFADNVSCRNLVRTGVPFREITKAATRLGGYGCFDNSWLYRPETRIPRQYGGTSGAACGLSCAGGVSTGARWQETEVVQTPKLTYGKDPVCGMAAAKLSS